MTMRLIGKGKIKELSSIGYSVDYYEFYGIGYATMEEAYNDIMANPKCSIVVASLTTDQREGKKLLLNNGFKQIGKTRVNPNSGNRISVFAKKIEKRNKKRK